MKRINLKNIFSFIAVFISFVFCLGTAIINPIFMKDCPAKYCSSLNFDNQYVNKNINNNSNCLFNNKNNFKTNENFYTDNDYCSYSFPNIGEFIRNLFKKNEKQTPTNKTYVYLGGYPLGFTISCKGVVVVAISNTESSGLQAGDIITKIDGEEIASVTQILNILNSESKRGQTVILEVNRKGEILKMNYKPVFDEEQKVYKLGLWVRDNSAGVGTLTYIRSDNFRFGALGHPVCDIDTGSIMPVGGGNIFKCNIVGYKRGVRGNAGELRGLFLRSSSMLGSLDKNNNFGVYGTFDKKYIAGFSGDLVEIASRNEVRSGKATIRTTIDGTIPKEYEIEIVKTYFQNSESNKSMFIRVTDERLLKTTGGIVQGMSGSPIIQNGKLVGAVTHVFVSDPTKGYGVYADWMINN